MYNIYSKYLSEMKELMIHDSHISCGTMADLGASKISNNFRKRKSKQ